MSRETKELAREARRRTEEAVAATRIQAAARGRRERRANAQRQRPALAGDFDEESTEEERRGTEKDKCAANGRSAAAEILDVDAGDHADVDAFIDGEHVEGNFAEHGSWYPGIVRLPTTHTGRYTIEYLDGDVEHDVEPRLIRRLGFKVGDRVEGEFGQGTFYPGVIRACNGDGTYHIAYDDGDVEEQKPASMLRREGTMLLADDGGERFELDERVEGDYKSTGMWYAGAIGNVHDDNTYDIYYDDGDIERGKLAFEIRRPTPNHTPNHTPSTTPRPGSAGALRRAVAQEANAGRDYVDGMPASRSESGEFDSDENTETLTISGDRPADRGYDDGAGSGSFSGGGSYSEDEYSFDSASGDSF